jgi:hypothetical protein
LALCRIAGAGHPAQTFKLQVRESSMPEPGQPASGKFIRDDTWAWWEARRLKYNIGLALAGWIAYGLYAAIFYAFGRPIWEHWNSALGITLFLGLGFLALMGVANIWYLVGAIAESVIQPTDRDAFRKRAFALGFWGSMAVPFLFPLANLAILIASSGRAP